MASALRTVRHDDQLSLVEHLDELRTRILVCLAVFITLFGIAFWQNDVILEVANRPFIQATSDQEATGTLAATRSLNERIGAASADLEVLVDAIAADEDVDQTTKAAAVAAADSLKDLAENIPSSERQPVTLGVAEPFTSTLRLAAYAAFLVALPFLLWQAYAFVLPAFSPKERRAALPLMMMVPFLFIGGAVFAYFVVLPSAIAVLQNFNSDNFDILVQAKDLYKFTILTCIALGVLFQVPVGILALTSLDIVTVATLRANRRYAILIMAVLAMLLPGTDPVTMLLSMAPLVVLFEGSILMAAFLDRRRARQVDEDDEDDDELGSLSRQGTDSDDLDDD